QDGEPALAAKLAAGWPEPGDLQPELGEGGASAGQVLSLLGGREARPFLVAPGVEGNLVAAAGDRPQRLRVGLRVEALDAEGGGEAAGGERREDCRQRLGHAWVPAGLGVGRDRAELDLSRLAEVVEAEAERSASAPGPGLGAGRPPSSPKRGAVHYSRSAGLQ